MSAAPHKSETPLAGGAIAKQSTDASIVAGYAAQCKTEDTLIAQFALAGHAVHRLAEGGYLVCRWGMVRQCRDLDALTAFARQVGVR